MLLFPDRPFETAGGFADAYFDQLSLAWMSVDRGAIQSASKMLAAAVAADVSIFSCGNGGSAAISNHLLCDCLKGVQAGTALRPRVHSLSNGVELITAIVNDIGPEEMFALPLRSLGRAEDVLIAISSSGASRNVVRAIQTAADIGMKTIAMTGFDGGEAAKLANVSLHVDAANYGIVEDVHQSLMHILAQNLRQSHLADRGQFGAVRF
ncbi:MAG: SIS domain-containing protein [Candidatus Brevundimonas colombiensis]|uniref:SIS domain-containing protein n=1 Tax=Candidatus Brevundimonas colombiensis TaxID=3121376 RepID=A0AAJ5X2H6_9CAUL|nr:SIS domain-containing protein [Brevundimonas sp.]WEK40932.1 MAG: SIS domain-containing protein [Brevundimonas sp.]